MTGRAEGRADVTAALRAAADAATQAADDAGGWDPGRRRDLLADLDRTMTALTAARSAVLIAERDAGTWRGAGDSSFAAWRGRTSGVGRGLAAAEERRAETLAGMPTMRDAALAGQVSVAHVDVVGRVTTQGSPAVRAALGAPEGRAEVLEMARRLDAPRFGRAMDRWAAAVDAAQLERTHEAERAGRFLHVVDGADGTRIRGRLDRMSGHRLRLALEALTPRPAADDERSADQRRADALTALADKVLSLPETTTGAAVRPHVSFLMTEETWSAFRAATAAGAAAGWQGGSSRPAPDAAPVTLEDGTPVPFSEVGRVLCDCELTLIVMSADGELLDLGRTVRTYTGAQRRAVIARDGGCAWDGCTMAARWCEVHHIRWWDRDDGATSVANGALLCSFHHHEIHRRDLVLARYTVDPAERRATGRRVGYLVTTRDGRPVAGAGRAAGGAGGVSPGGGSPGGGSPGGDSPGEGGSGGGSPGGGSPGGGRSPGGWSGEARERSTTRGARARPQDQLALAI